MAQEKSKQPLEAQEGRQPTSQPSTTVVVLTAATLHTQSADLQAVCSAAKGAGIRVAVGLCRPLDEASVTRVTPQFLDASEAAAMCGCKIDFVRTGALPSCMAVIHSGQAWVDGALFT